MRSAPYLVAITYSKRPPCLNFAVYIVSIQSYMLPRQLDVLLIKTQQYSAILITRVSFQRWTNVKRFVQDSPTPLIFGVTETRLNEDVAEGEVAIHIHTHTVYRRDRRDRGHGGVLVYIPKEIRSFIRMDLERDGLEAVWVELRTKIGTFAFLMALLEAFLSDL